MGSEELFSLNVSQLPLLTANEGTRRSWAVIDAKWKVQLEIVCLECGQRGRAALSPQLRATQTLLLCLSVPSLVLRKVMECSSTGICWTKKPCQELPALSSVWPSSSCRSKCARAGQDTEHNAFSHSPVCKEHMEPARWGAEHSETTAQLPGLRES